MPDELRLVQTSGAYPCDIWSGGTAFGANDNGEGVSNGLAFLLGASDPNVSSLANGAWTSVAVPDASGTVSDVVFTITGTGPLNVTATIPASKAAAGKLFGHVKGVNP